MASAGYVLVGGGSSRFSGDKARFAVEGKPLVVLTADKVLRAAGSVALVGPPERYGDLGMRVIPDPVTGFGPLAGIVAALEDTPAERNLIVAVDLPGITVELLSFLLGCRGEVVLPVQPDGRPQPLCAVYDRRAAPVLRAAMENGRGKITTAIEALGVRRIGPDAYARFGGAKLFRNLNRPEDAS